MERTRGNGALFDQFPLRILRFDPFKTPSQGDNQKSTALVLFGKLSLAVHLLSIETVTREI